MNAVVVDTPLYVLLDGNRRIGPTVVPSNSAVECSPVYGFSDKVPYDVFRGNTELALTPYPLVKVYLRSQAGVPGDGPRLLVVDAAGPRDPYLQAATMEAVLEAQENRATHVKAAYRLAFDEEANAYRLEEASV